MIDRAADSKLNNFSRMEPTLHLLDIPFDLNIAQAIMTEQYGVATRLLYQLYIALQRKKKARLTGVAMEAMRPAAPANLQNIESGIYKELLKKIVPREADLKLKQVSQRYEQKRKKIEEKVNLAHYEELRKIQKMQQDLRLQDIEKHRLVKRRQGEIMARIQAAIVQIPKPPPNRTLEAIAAQKQQRKKQEAQEVYNEISHFEKMRKRLSPSGGSNAAQGILQTSFQSEGLSSKYVSPSPEEKTHAYNEYIQKIHRWLEEDAAAREHREKRRRRVLLEQLKAHEAQELMREWKELFYNGKPLYEKASVDPIPSEPNPEQLLELEKLQILDEQDYEEFQSTKAKSDQCYCYKVFFYLLALLVNNCFVFKEMLGREREEPTLHLLDIPFDLNIAQAIMTEQYGVATRLLYQLYIALQRKKKARLTGVAMEAMRPAAPANLQTIESGIYKEHRLVKRRQGEIMARIQAAIVQIPKPPPNRTLEAIAAQKQQRKKQEAQEVYNEISHFEKMRKRLSPSGGSNAAQGILQTSFQSEGLSSKYVSPSPEEKTHAYKEYIQKIHRRLEEDAAAREHREKRRRRVLLEQLKAHEAQEEAYREEQLVNRLMRQSQQERRMAVQLMHARHEKDIIRQNRIMREKQYEERRLLEFQEALDREAALAKQEKIDYMEQTCKEIELHDAIAAEYAEARYRKHFDICQDVLNQIIDLVTKAGEYRELTHNLLPVKLMREWKELFDNGKPLYEKASVDPIPSEPNPEQPLELEKVQILDDQDYEEFQIFAFIVFPIKELCSQSQMCYLASAFTSWCTCFPVRKPVIPAASKADTAGCASCHRWCSEPVQRQKPQAKTEAVQQPEEFAAKGLVDLIQWFESHELLGGCMVSQSADGTCFGGQCVFVFVLPSQRRGGSGRGRQPIDIRLSVMAVTRGGGGDPLAIDDLARQWPSQLLYAFPLLALLPLCLEKIRQDQAKLTARAQLGAVLEKILKKGKSVPDEQLVDTIVEAISRLPAESGWVLDGFPVNLNQAKLLEKALSGIDPDKAISKKMKKRKTSVLTTDPTAPKEPPSPPPVLDLAVLFDVSDNMVLRRAAGSTYGQQSSDLRQEEFNQPPEGSITGVGSKEMVAAVKDLSHGQEQIQHRITGFLDTWPKLEDWFGGRQNILVKVNAEMEEDIVCKKVESILFEAMIQKEQKGKKLPIEEEKKETIPAPPAPAPAPTPPATPVHPAEKRPRSKSPKEKSLKSILNALTTSKNFCLNGNMSTTASLMTCEKMRRQKQNCTRELTYVSVDRFQDTLCLLCDYYKGIEKNILPEASQEFTRIPLVDIINVDQNGDLEVPKSGSVQSERQTKSAAKKETGGEDKKQQIKKIPLVSRRPLSSDQSGTKIKNRTANESKDEMLVRDIWQAALTAVSNMIAAEVQQRETEETEEQQQIEEGDRQRSSQASAAAGGKDKKKDQKSAKKKGASSPTPPPPPPPSEDDIEEEKKRELKAKMRQEYFSALEHEEYMVKARLELIKSKSLAVVRDLLRKAEEAYKEIEEWFGARFLAEMKRFPSTQVPPQALAFTQTTNPPIRIYVQKDGHEIQELMALLTLDSELIDWHKFLLLAAQPWPYPSQRQLLQTLERFKGLDTDGSGFVTEEQFNKAVKQLDYVNMLLYFAAHPDPVQGFYRALSVTTGEYITGRKTSSNLLKSVPNMDEIASDEPPGSETPPAADEGRVSLGALFKALCHGGFKTGDHNRFHSQDKTLAEYYENISQIYKELGYEDSEAIPYSILSQHPFMLDLIENNLRYKLTTANTYRELSLNTSTNPDSTTLLFTNKLYFTTCTLTLTLDL
ncbi:UNVERIFIED_CONTAM: hypothetical protein FKN15_073429 [Acipenser sinensis]